MMFAQIAVPAPLRPLDILLDYRIPEELAELVSPGTLVEVPLGRQKTWGLVFSTSLKPTFQAKNYRDILGVKLPFPIFSEGRLRFLHWLSKHYFFPLGECAESAIPGPIRSGTKRTLKLPTTKASNPPALKPTLNLNPAQAAAVTSISKTFGTASSHLLWGITGSGKTEVYLRLIDSILLLGQGAIVLVPEIALTPQLAQRFEDRFPGEVAIFHSAQKPTELRKAYLEVALGFKNIVLGPRSALFAPVVNPGLIIVDEEHDGSYKQEERLRYHARDAAECLAALLKIPVVLGSATPSCETFLSAREGRITSHELPERAVENAKLPQIELVDLRQTLAVQNKDPAAIPDPEEFQIAAPKDAYILSPRLLSELEETIRRGDQSILFLNRRGLGSSLICRDCGHQPECPNCSVTLTPHRNSVLCHYCGYELKSAPDCSSCKAPASHLMQLGVGTERVEELLHLYFPKLEIGRLDRDTTEKRDDLFRVLDEFKTRKTQILVGTQMVAKGHDFPSVRLVGVLLAELGLSVPDFRAEERMLQTLLQVSGRAGRAELPGKVIVQTFNPEHPIFARLSSGGSLNAYKRFLEDEVSRRKDLNYPPSGRLALIRLDGAEVSKVSQAAHAVAAGLKRLNAPGLEVLGPVPSPINFVRGRHRFQILLKSLNKKNLHLSVAWIENGWAEKKLEREYKTRLMIDVDPVQMM